MHIVNMINKSASSCTHFCTSSSIEQIKISIACWLEAIKFRGSIQVCAADIDYNEFQGVFTHQDSDLEFKIQDEDEHKYGRQYYG